MDAERKSPGLAALLAGGMRRRELLQAGVGATLAFGLASR
jgi:hypothetical protein